MSRSYAGRLSQVLAVEPDPIRRRADEVHMPETVLTERQLVCR